MSGRESATGLPLIRWDPQRMPDIQGGPPDSLKPQGEEPLRDKPTVHHLPAATPTSAGYDELVPDFVRKLHNMLLDSSTSSIVSWGASGTTLVVHQPVVFAATVLPQWFKHSNFASFVRQLNKYDFHKVQGADQRYGEGAWEWQNPHFVENCVHLLKFIRRKPAGRRTKKETRPVTNQMSNPGAHTAHSDSGSRIGLEGASNGKDNIHVQSNQPTATTSSSEGRTCWEDFFMTVANVQADMAQNVQRLSSSYTLLVSEVFKLRHHLSIIADIVQNVQQAQRGGKETFRPKAVHGVFGPEADHVQSMADQLTGPNAARASELQMDSGTITTTHHHHQYWGMVSGVNSLSSVSYAEMEKDGQQQQRQRPEQDKEQQQRQLSQQEHHQSDHRHHQPLEQQQARQEQLKKTTRHGQTLRKQHQPPPTPLAEKQHTQEHHQPHHQQPHSHHRHTQQQPQEIQGEEQSHQHRTQKTHPHEQRHGPLQPPLPSTRPTFPQGQHDPSPPPTSSISPRPHHFPNETALTVNSLFKKVDSTAVGSGPPHPLYLQPVTVAATQLPTGNTHGSNMNHHQPNGEQPACLDYTIPAVPLSIQGSGGLGGDLSLQQQQQTGHQVLLQQRLRPQQEHRLHHTHPSDELAVGGRGGQLVNSRNGGFTAAATPTGMSATTTTTSTTAYEYMFGHMF